VLLHLITKATTPVSCHKHKYFVPKTAKSSSFTNMMRLTVFFRMHASLRQEMEYASQGSLSILKLIWSYRHKRCPNGTLLKLSKTCIYASNGSMELCCCLCLILATMLGIPTQQIDFTQAFCNADINRDVYIGIPQGWYYSIVSENLNNTRIPDLRICNTACKLSRTFTAPNKPLKTGILAILSDFTAPNKPLETGIFCWTDKLQTRRQRRSVKMTKDVKREDLWRSVLNNDLISLSIDN
jgi:hypothetical protein